MPGISAHDTGPTRLAVVEKKALLTGGSDSAVKCFSLSADGVLPQPLRVFDGNTEQIMCIDVDRATAGLPLEQQRIAVGGQDGMVVFYDGTNPARTIFRQAASMVYAAVFSTDGSRVAVGSDNGLRVVQTAKGGVDVVELPPPFERGEAALSAAWLESDVLVVATTGRVSAWNMASDPPAHIPFPKDIRLTQLRQRNETTALRMVAFNFPVDKHDEAVQPDPVLSIAVPRGKHVVVQQLPSQQPLPPPTLFTIPDLAGREEALLCAVSPNGRLLVTLDTLGYLSVLDLRAQSFLHRTRPAFAVNEATEEAVEICDFAFHPLDATTILAMTSEGSVQVLNGFVEEPKEAEADPKEEAPEAESNLKKRVEFDAPMEAAGAGEEEASEEGTQGEAPDGGGTGSAPSKAGGASCSLPETRISEGGAVVEIETRLAPFQPGQSPPPGHPSTEGFRILCWNRVGFVRSHAAGEGGAQTITAVFYDKSQLPRKTITDPPSKHDFQLSIAALGRKAVALASSAYSSDAGQRGPKRHRIAFHSVAGATWTQSFPQGEEPQCVALGDAWVACFSGLNYLRVWSAAGVALHVLSLPYRPVSCLGMDSPISPAHGDVPLEYDPAHILAGVFDDGTSTLKFCVWTVDTDSVTPLHHDKSSPESPYRKLCLTPDSSLAWIGWADEGMLAAHDSKQILRVFSPALFGGQWVPVNHPHSAGEGWARLHALFIRDNHFTAVKIENGVGPDPRLESYTHVQVRQPLVVPVLGPSSGRNAAWCEKEAACLMAQLVLLEKRRRAETTGVGYTDDIRRLEAKQDALIRALVYECVTGRDGSSATALSICAGVNSRQSLEGIAELAEKLKEEELAEKVKQLIAVDFAAKNRTRRTALAPAKNRQPAQAAPADGITIGKPLTGPQPDAAAAAAAHPAAKPLHFEVPAPLRQPVRYVTRVDSARTEKFFAPVPEADGSSSDCDYVGELRPAKPAAGPAEPPPAAPAKRAGGGEQRGRVGGEKPKKRRRALPPTLSFSAAAAAARDPPADAAAAAADAGKKRKAAGAEAPAKKRKPGGKGAPAAAVASPATENAPAGEEAREAAGPEAGAAAGAAKKRKPSGKGAGKPSRKKPAPKQPAAGAQRAGLLAFMPGLQPAAAAAPSSQPLDPPVPAGAGEQFAAPSPSPGSSQNAAGGDACALEVAPTAADAGKPADGLSRLRSAKFTRPKKSAPAAAAGPAPAEPAVGEEGDPTTPVGRATAAAAEAAPTPAGGLARLQSVKVSRAKKSAPQAPASGEQSPGAVGEGGGQAPAAEAAPSPTGGLARLQSVKFNRTKKSAPAAAQQAPASGEPTGSDAGAAKRDEPQPAVLDASPRVRSNEQSTPAATTVPAAQPEVEEVLRAAGGEPQRQPAPTTAAAEAAPSPAGGLARMQSAKFNRSQKSAPAAAQQASAEREEPQPVVPKASPRAEQSTPAVAAAPAAQPEVEEVLRSEEGAGATAAGGKPQRQPPPTTAAAGAAPSQTGGLARLQSVKFNRSKKSAPAARKPAEPAPASAEPTGSDAGAVEKEEPQPVVLDASPRVGSTEQSTPAAAAAPAARPEVDSGRLRFEGASATAAGDEPAPLPTPNAPQRQPPPTPAEPATAAEEADRVARLLSAEFNRSKKSAPAAAEPAPASAEPTGPDAGAVEKEGPQPVVLDASPRVGLTEQLTPAVTTEPAAQTEARQRLLSAKSEEAAPAPSSAASAPSRQPPVAKAADGLSRLLSAKFKRPKKAEAPPPKANAPPGASAALPLPNSPPAELSTPAAKGHAPAAELASLRSSAAEPDAREVPAAKAEGEGAPAEPCASRPPSAKSSRSEEAARAPGSVAAAAPAAAQSTASADGAEAAIPAPGPVEESTASEFVDTDVSVELPEPPKAPSPCISAVLTSSPPVVESLVFDEPSEPDSKPVASSAYDAMVSELASLEDLVNDFEVDQLPVKKRRPLPESLIFDSLAQPDEED
ncbi:hypothetical protein DIPPA_12831 [Diplonema papillatum]|nr:hypothetical protein DIPPA_12831 [Diplonema papillatum]